MPHATTLLKLVQKYGPDMLDQLNETLVQKAREKKVIRGQKLRVDTTVIQSDIEYPTDASLLAKVVRTITRLVKKIQDTGVVSAPRFRDCTRSVKQSILSIAKILRRRSGEAQAEVAELTKKILGTARRIVTGGKAIAYQTEEALGEMAEATARKVKGLIQQLQQATGRTQTIVEQTRQVLSGNRQIPNRLVSLVDPDARPIKKGSLKAPTEFGYKAVLRETEERVITGYDVLEGNPKDDSLLIRQVDQHRQQFRRAPKTVATDRGFAHKDNESTLTEMGVERVAIPHRGKKSAARQAYEKQRWFRSAQRWRAGGEGTISLLKRKYGMRRTRLRGHKGARCWMAGAVFAHNLVRLATIG